MTDNDIKIFFGKFKKFRWDRLKYKYNHIYEYLINRYDDLDSPKESYFRIINNIENRPTCKICGKRVKFNDRKNNFENTCSYKCTNILRYESIKKFNINHYGVENYYASEKFKKQITEYNLKNFGVEHVFQRNDVKEKIKKTSLERYGVENAGGSKQSLEKIKKTTYEHYGVECSLSSPEIREKIKKTCNKKYGGNSPYSSETVRNKAKQNALIKYGVECWQKTDKAREYMSKKISSDEVQSKTINTKRKNKSFNTSKHEKYILEKLKNKFNCVKYQYKNILYPYRCDFYIEDKDLYIEYNGTWTHGNHMFDINNENDLKLLNIWKEKSVNHKYYNTAIYVWTILDLEKYNIAKQNNLNYLIFYSLKEFDEWYENL